jgi:hypothetical protein
MRVQDRFAFSFAVLGIAQPQHVHLDTGSHQSDEGMDVLRMPGVASNSGFAIRATSRDFDGVTASMAKR